MVDILLPAQTAIEFREYFVELGLSRPTEAAISKLNTALKQEGLEPLKHPTEVLVLNEKFQPAPDTSGCLGFLFTLFYEQRTTKFHAVIWYSGNDLYPITQGEVFITNSRIIVLSSEGAGSAVNVFVDLGTLQVVDYEAVNNTPMLTLSLENEIVQFLITYPRPSPATMLASTGSSSTSEEVYQKIQAERTAEQLNMQGSTTKELLYNYFVAMLQD